MVRIGEYGVLERRMYLVLNDTMLAISKSNKYKTCQPKKKKTTYKLDSQNKNTRFFFFG